MVTMGAVAGDPVALESFRAVGGWLGHGMADLAAILDPQVFIIGGGVSEAGELLVGPARETFEAMLTARSHRPTAAVRLGQVDGADRRRRPGPDVTTPIHPRRDLTVCRLRQRTSTRLRPRFQVQIGSMH